MTDLILHHYEASPYSEKIRTLMGFKGLSWSSVIGQFKKLPASIFLLATFIVNNF